MCRICSSERRRMVLVVAASYCSCPLGWIPAASFRVVVLLSTSIVSQDAQLLLLPLPLAVLYEDGDDDRVSKTVLSAAPGLEKSRCSRNQSA